MLVNVQNNYKEVRKTYFIFLNENRYSNLLLSYFRQACACLIMCLISLLTSEIIVRSCLNRFIILLIAESDHLAPHETTFSLRGVIIYILYKN